MLSSVLNAANKDWKRIVAFDIALFFVIVTFVNTYKTFFFVLTGTLVAYLTYRFVNYFIEVSAKQARPSCSDQPIDLDDDLYEFKLANLLFRNATLIRTIKMLSRNR